MSDEQETEREVLVIIDHGVLSGVRVVREPDAIIEAARMGKPGLTSRLVPESLARDLEEGWEKYFNAYEALGKYPEVVPRQYVITKFISGERVLATMEHPR
jgi:hypothetical protein